MGTRGVKLGLPKCKSIKFASTDKSQIRVPYSNPNRVQFGAQYATCADQCNLKKIIAKIACFPQMMLLHGRGGAVQYIRHVLYWDFKTHLIIFSVAILLCIIQLNSTSMEVIIWDCVFPLRRNNGIVKSTTAWIQLFRESSAFHLIPLE